MRADELRGSRKDVATTFPHLADHYAGDLTALPVEQHWFARHQILRLDALMATGLRMFGARGGGKLILLSGRLDRFAELVAAEKPRGLDASTVVAYIEACDEWTSPYDVRPIQVSSVEDVALRSRGPGDAERMTRLAQELGREIKAPGVSRAAGCLIVTRYVLLGGRLVRRTLTVDAGGALRRDDVVLASRLPALVRANG